MDLDLRNISSRPESLESTCDINDMVMKFTYTNETITRKTKNGPTFLLKVEEVEEFVWQFLGGEFDIKASNHYMPYELCYEIGLEGDIDPPQIVDAVKERIDHILSCVSWEECPVCGTVIYKYINPDDLSYIWEENFFNCCSDELRRTAADYQRALDNGDIHQDAYDAAIDRLSILVDENDLQEVIEMGMELCNQEMAIT